MAVDMNCPCCQKKLSVEEGFLGKRINCTHCHSSILVPESPMMPVPAEEKTTAAVASSGPSIQNQAPRWKIAAGIFILLVGNVALMILLSFAFATATNNRDFTWPVLISAFVVSVLLIFLGRACSENELLKFLYVLLLTGIVPGLIVFMGWEAGTCLAPSRRFFGDGVQPTP